MNLIGDPWIPVVFKSGATSHVGLRGAFERAEEIRDLVVTPPERIALTRLLVCITQTALDGPSDEAAWSTSKKTIVPSSLSYLEQWSSAFNLYGDQPFLQASSLRPTDNALLDKLGFELAAGNNATLFDHEACPEGREHVHSWQALKLVTYQCFSPGGLIGESEWNGKRTGRTSKHAPCVESSMLHLILRGSNLLNTLYLNLLTKSQVKGLPNGKWGSPVWESFPDDRESPEALHHAQSYLGRLVPVSRAILLKPDSYHFTLANGVSFPRLPEWREPAATVVARGGDSNEEYRYLGVDLSKHPWRELGSLLASQEGYRGGALPLQHLIHLRPSQATIDLWTGGLAVDRRKAGKILDVAEWNFAIPLSLLGERPLEIYRGGVDRASKGEASLRKAVNRYCNDMGIREDWKSELRKQLLSKAATQYWSELDRSYEVLLHAAAELNQKRLIDWNAVLFRAMRCSYSHTCSSMTARQIKAYARAESSLRLPSLEGVGSEEHQVT